MGRARHSLVRTSPTRRKKFRRVSGRASGRLSGLSDGDPGTRDFRGRPPRDGRGYRTAAAALVGRGDGRDTAGPAPFTAARSLSQ